MTKNIKKPSAQEVDAAIKTLISWTGDDVEREGLIETPKRVRKAYQEFFSGYEADPVEILGKTFEDVSGYNDIVLLKNMTFESHCEHHIVPIIGRANIAYIPNEKVVGISKIARLLDAFAKRLQTQETMTAQIANTIFDVLKPQGVAVLIDAEHQCMTTRGVYKPKTTTVTSTFLGSFQDQQKLEDRFYKMISL